MRRRAVAESFEQEAEALLRRFRREVERAEGELLHFGVVYPYRAAAELRAVEHDVVGAGADLAGLGEHVLHVLVHRRGEGMVDGGVASAFVVPFKERELRDPEEAEAFLDHAARAAELEAYLPEYLAGLAPAFVGHDEERVAVLYRGELAQLRELIFAEEFDERAFELAVFREEVRHALRAERLRAAFELGELLARERRAAGQTEPLYRAAVRYELREGVLAVTEDFFEADHLHRDAHVGLVDAVFVHRLVPGHAQERRLDLDAVDFLEESREVILDERHYVLFGDEAHLEVELGELGLAVGAEVFVAEALDYLHVAVAAGDHEELLEELRRLRQRVEAAGVDAARHEVVARALGRGLREHRRFDVDEAVVGEVVARVARDVVADAQVALHRIAADVEVAVFHAQVFVDIVGVVKLEGRQLRRREDDEVLDEKLHFAGRELGVLRPLGALAERALDREHVLAAQRARAVVRVGVELGVEDYLRHSGLVPELYEDYPSEVAAASEPAVEDGLLARVFGARRSAVHRPAPRCVKISFHLENPLRL